MRKAVDILLPNYTVIVTQLETLVTDLNIKTKKERGRLVGILRKVKSVKFLSCYCFLDTLQPLSKLSLVLQSDNVHVLMFLSALKEFYDFIKYLKDRKYSLELSQILLQLKNVF